MHTEFEFWIEANYGSTRILLARVEIFIQSIYPFYYFAQWFGAYIVGGRRVGEGRMVGASITERNWSGTGKSGGGTGGIEQIHWQVRREQPEESQRTMFNGILVF